VLAARTSQSDVPTAKELIIEVKADNPWNLTFMSVSVPVVTSMVSVPEKVVPVKVPNGVHVPETLNMVALAGQATERAATAAKIKEQRIAAGISVFIVISSLEPMRRDYCRSKLATGKAQ
jgi:hypothetical protein